MNTYLQLLLVAAVVLYIVDLSGFTDSWRDALSRALGIKAPNRLRALPPFDCGACLTWWASLAWAAFVCREFTLPVVAYCAALAALEPLAVSVAACIRETVNNICNTITDKTTPK